MYFSFYTKVMTDYLNYLAGFLIIINYIRIYGHILIKVEINLLLIS